MKPLDLLDAGAHLAVLVSGGPLVSVVVGFVLVDTLGGVLGAQIRPLLAQITQISGHQLKVVPRETRETIGVRVNLNFETKKNYECCKKEKSFIQKFVTSLFCWRFSL